MYSCYGYNLSFKTHDRTVPIEILTKHAYLNTYAIKFKPILIRLHGAIVIAKHSPLEISKKI